MAVTFQEIFRKELEVVNFRRKNVRMGVQESSPRANDEPMSEARGDRQRRHRRFIVPRRTEVALDDRSGSAEEHAAKRTKSDSEMEKWRTVRLKRGANLTGLALSGGGIRSASFCLGVLQALDSLTKDDEPQVLDAVDYLSTVSGGGYIGASLVAALNQDISFPFDSRLDRQETPETQHLRDFSNFLVPNGARDYLVSAALVIRGLLVNAVIVSPFLLVPAVLTVVLYPLFDQKSYRPFTLTIVLAGVAALFVFASAIYTSRLFNTGTPKSRQRLGYWLVAAVAIPCCVAAFEFQPVIISRMVCVAKGAGTGGASTSASIGLFPTLAAVLAPAAALLIAASQKLANIAKASVGDDMWTGLVKKYSSRAMLYVAALIVPLLLWIAYLYLGYYAVEDLGAGAATTSPLVLLYRTVAVASFLLCLLIGPNSNSLHALYRDRLARAFLFDRARLAGSEAGAAPTGDSSDTFETRKLSCLKPRNATTGRWGPSAANAPYLLINTAINLLGSDELDRRGRDADVFIFSPLHVGSRATGYVSTVDMEKGIKNLSLATAMAISGAAASANMGDMTIRPLTFSLSLLNIRLGYWLSNPAKLQEFTSWANRKLANIGTWYFALETAGKLDETTLNVYLTDGGHIENLGVYELLQRRCRVIFAVDAEADPGMTFSALAHLELIARIDLGVRIDLPWQALQKSALGVTGTALYGPGGPPGAKGPHAAIGLIRYDDDDNDDDVGILIYVKSSLSGDESDYLLDYKRRNDTFPHETTVDQFFKEEQFEVYRALGFHAVRRLLTGEDDFARPDDPPNGFDARVKKALALLNVPTSMANAMAARIAKKPTSGVPQPAGGVW
jgi:predicted acylesterase/phospholipase RssA